VFGGVAEIGLIGPTGRMGPAYLFHWSYFVPEVTCTAPVIYLRLILLIMQLSLGYRLKGTCCDVFRGRGGWRLCFQQNGALNRVSRNLSPGALALGSLKACHFPATTGLLTYFPLSHELVILNLGPHAAGCDGNACGAILRGRFAVRSQRIFRRRATRQLDFWHARQGRYVSSREVRSAGRA
jgi:hypothetical protein